MWHEMAWNCRFKAAYWCRVHRWEPRSAV